MTRKHVLGAATQIPPGEGRAFQIGEHAIAVFRTRAGSVFATQARCPHQRGPLADGLVGSDTLVCPLHEWTFDLPTGTARQGACSLRIYAIEQREDGTLEVALD